MSECASLVSEMSVSMLTSEGLLQRGNKTAFELGKESSSTKAMAPMTSWATSCT